MATNGTKTEGGNAQGFVTVAVKLPNGVILETFREETAHEPVMGGGFREYKIWTRTGQRHELTGYAAPWGQSPKVPVVGGYAINHNVPAAIWEQWLSHNRDSDLVRNGLIFAYPNARDAEAQAKDGEKIWAGLEPLMPDEYDASGRLIARDRRAGGTGPMQRAS